jgi:hypothetical protein
MEGTIFAERARLELASAGPYRGVFSAQELQVRPDTVLYNVPYCAVPPKH